MARKNSINWVHQITLPSGEVTPGKWLPLFDEYGLPEIEFKNRRVLDIGCLDGVYSFYAEQQGAKEVLSIDITENEKQDHIQATYTNEAYLYAHRARNSKAKYIFPYSLYDLTKKSVGEFDIILSLGVIYHLAHPLLSLEKINGVMKTDGILVLETEVSDTFTMFYHKMMHTRGHIKRGTVTNTKIATSALSYFAARPLNEKIRLIKFLFIQKARSALWSLVRPLLYPRADIYKNQDTSVFYVTDDIVMRRMIDFSGFKIMKMIPNPLSTRITYVCQKVSNVDPVYAQQGTYTDRKKRTTNFELK